MTTARKLPADLVNPGDMMILVHPDGKPEVVNAVSITKAGSIRVSGFNRLFKVSKILVPVVPEWNWDYGGHSNFHYPIRTSLYLFTEANLCQLQAIYDEKEREREEERIQQEQKKKEREDRYRARIMEVKSVCGNSLVGHRDWIEALPDGARLYALSLPVRPSEMERKMYTRAFVKVWDDESIDENDKEGVRFCFSYIDHRTSSFVSASTGSSPDDESALWEVASHCYHGW